LQSDQFIYRFGFSASVFGKNTIKNMTIKQFIGDVIYTKDNQKLIDEKKVAKPNFKIIKINKPYLQKIKNWKVIEKLGIIQNNYRNQKVVELCIKIKKQTLILVKKIEHGEEIKQLLESNNIKCVFLHGKHTKEERKKVLQEFEKNNNEFVLIGSTILKEGVSINAIFNLIYAGAGSSFVDTLQSIFRGTRIKLKDEFNVFDFLDEFNPITLKHSNQRIKLYKEKVYDNIRIIKG
jgi:superfamily II DNA or RNA helicase